MPRGIERDVVVVDDCSTDGTAAALQTFGKENLGLPIVLEQHVVKQRKGVALHTAIHRARGDFLIVQDADLDYDPRGYTSLLRPILEDRADVVYGSRFARRRPHRILFFWHSIGHRLLTTVSNPRTHLNLTGIESCDRLFRASSLKSIGLRKRRLGFEPEVMAKVARPPDPRLYEVGISYYGRTYAEGQKIPWQDGLRARYCIVTCGLLRR